MLMASNLNIDVTLAPSDKRSELIPLVNLTLRGALSSRREKMDFIGQIVFDCFCGQLDFICVDGIFHFGVEY